MQCVVKDDSATGKRVVAGTHWDFDSYGGTIKKQMGMPTQVNLLQLVLICCGHDNLSDMQVDAKCCVHHITSAV